jgi:uncharacterized protein (TIGR03435 family)
VDRTGFTGRYDFTLEWSPLRAGAVARCLGAGYDQAEMPGDN